MTATVLEVVDLHKHFGPTLALNGVNFQVTSGEIFGLLGPNGAGKTTLLSILSFLLSPNRGEVHILGRPWNMRDRDLRRHIGIVPQELAIYGELSAPENLAFFGRLYGLEGTFLRRRVEEVLDAIGLADRGGARVDTFSGGMKRRLNLGAAIMHQPDLLLLDEPTTGVDPQSRNRIFEEVRRLNAAGTTILYTSHYMEEVQALCTRIGIMDNGRIIACDTLAGLLGRLSGGIRFQVPKVTSELLFRLGEIPDVSLAEQNGRMVDLKCRNVPSTLLRLVGLLNELQLELTHLETEEPSLERIFLDLTGRALRD